MNEHSWKIHGNNVWYVDDFIEKQILPFHRKIYPTNAFLSFGIICSSIEFLGKCLDDENDFEESDSENYFKLALKELMPEYWKISSQNGISLYKSLRCGLIHSVRPGDRVWLRERHTAVVPHLTISDKKLHIIIESFVADFEIAAIEVVKRIRTGNYYNHPKFYQPFIQY